VADDDLVCPECGGPIGTTSTYCMHCSADLTAPAEDAATERDGGWTAASEDATAAVAEATAAGDESVATPQDLPADLRPSRGGLETPRLLPENFFLKAGTFVLAMAVGFAAGIGCIVVLTSLISNDLAFVGGVVAWFATTGTILRIVPG